jgi:hypothetical protein
MMSTLAAHRKEGVHKVTNRDKVNMAAERFLESTQDS